MKTRNIIPLLTVIIIALLAGCKKDDFQEMKMECLSVESVSPMNGAVGVPLSPDIYVFFNEDLMPATSCAVSSPINLQGSKSIDGAFYYCGKKATFTPSESLLPGTIYTVTITKELKNKAGISLPENFVWSFKTAGEAVSNNISTATSGYL